MTPKSDVECWNCDEFLCLSQSMSYPLCSAGLMNTFIDVLFFVLSTSAAIATILLMHELWTGRRG